MAASKRLTATLIATSLATLAQAATDPLMDKALESADPVGRLCSGQVFPDTLLRSFS